MRTHFQNITVTIDAPTPEEAYAKLCATLGGLGAFETDTYHTGDENELPTTLLAKKPERP